MCELFYKPNHVKLESPWFGFIVHRNDYRFRIEIMTDSELFENFKSKKFESKSHIYWQFYKIIYNFI